MATWADLPYDLLLFTVRLLKKFKDFAAFGAVCKSWNAAANKEYFKALWMQETTPYLMLPVMGKNIRDLYSLAEGEIVASLRFRNSCRRKCYESLGWFLAVGKDGSMCLLDPFSRNEIPLPHQNTLPGFKQTHPTLLDFTATHPFKVVRKMVLSARPSETSDFVVALIFRDLVDIAFWRPGDTSWHRIRNNHGEMYEDITYHAGNFYSFDELSVVKIFNVLEGYPTEGHVIGRLVADMENDVMMKLLANKNVYIVKTSDSLLLVARTVSQGYGDVCAKTRKFEVYQFHMSSLSTWREIDNLGNLALFVGSGNASTVVDASRFPGYIKANHIYFTDDGGRNPYGSDGRPDNVTGQDMGVYNLESGTIDPFYHGEAFHSEVSHPTWIMPFVWSSNCQ